MSEALPMLARAVLDTARAWAFAHRHGSAATGEHMDLLAAVDALNEMLAIEAAPEEERVPWARVVVGDSVKLKSGQWAPVVERWMRRHGMAQVTVELPPVDASDPDAAPRRRTYTMPGIKEVTRRAGSADEAAAIALLIEQLGARVIMSREETW